LNPFKENACIDFDNLKIDIYDIVEAMDDVLDENIENHALPEQRDMAKTYRNIGIGIMGLHDALIKLRLVYGSDEAVEITNSLMKFIFREAVISSTKLAKVRGNFPGYSKDVWKSDILKNAFTKEELSKLEENNLLRNCSLLSVAPTGSIGTMLNISTGVEPFFATTYTRKTVSLDGQESYYSVDVPVIEEAKKYNISEDCLITSAQINWVNRINMQAAMQEFVDTAISSTINLPKETTSKDIEELYRYAWVKGLKGVTIYVDGSRDPILSTNITDSNKDCNCNCGTLTHSAPKRPKYLTCDVKRFKNGGDKWIACVGLFNDQPYEIFTGLAEKLDLPDYVTKCSIIKNKVDGKVLNKETGQEETKKVSRYDLMYSDKDGNMQVKENIGNLFNSEFYNVSKMTSAVLRHGMPIEFVISTIKSLDFKNDTINSWKAGVIRALKSYVKDGEVQGEVCPECGGKIVRENGCKHCTNCGWSACG